MRKAFFLFLVVLPLLSVAQLIQLKGYAPEYIGKEVTLSKIVDYISYNEEVIARSEVKTDSIFELNFFFSSTEKVRLQVGKNYAFLYLQPGASYEIYFPGSSKYDPVHPEGSEMELLFRSLPKQDINYKILEFDRWLTAFIGENFHTKSMADGQFGQKLDTLKMNMQKYYSKDTSSFFKTTIMFRLAELDEASYYGARSELERFDHYLLHHPVSYDNDAYMDYVNKFFKDFFERTSMEINNRIYLGVLKASPTLLFNALGQDYRMKNLRLREMVMIKGLGELYYNPDYPQTNISRMLDSLSNHALFAHNKIIAKNLKQKLTNLVPGSPSPRFAVVDYAGAEISPSSFPAKYKYIQFILSESVTGKNEVELMKPMYTKYGNYVEFITVLVDEPAAETLQKDPVLSTISWTLAKPKNESDIKEQFNLRTFPHYVLIDPDGFIVGNPAQRPSPDGQYETIDKTFFEIHKVMMKIPD